MSRTKGSPSPFSQLFWVNKGYTPEEADFKRNSMRPIRKEYWMAKGESEESAVLLALKTKTDNNKKGARASGDRPKDQIKLSSPRCKEYWIDKFGFSETEAKKRVSEQQITFSLDICIEKHGLILGTEIFNTRQRNWQNTLYSKPIAEIQDMHRRRNGIVLSDNIEETIQHLNKVRRMSLVANLDDFYEYVKNLLDDLPSLLFDDFHIFMAKLPKIQVQILLVNYSLSEIEHKISDLFSKIPQKFIIKNCKYSYNSMRTKDGLLRSSLEIYFYEKFIDRFTFKIDKPYPNSTFRYDFFIKDMYIEICPDYYRNEEYRLKMDKKQKLFGCKFLKNKSEIDEFYNIMIHQYENHS